jgi:hypothetical protein
LSYKRIEGDEDKDENSEMPKDADGYWEDRKVNSPK